MAFLTLYRLASYLPHFTDKKLRLRETHDLVTRVSVHIKVRRTQVS